MAKKLESGGEQHFEINSEIQKIEAVIEKLRQGAGDEKEIKQELLNISDLYLEIGKKAADLVDNKKTRVKANDLLSLLGKVKRTVDNFRLSGKVDVDMLEQDIESVKKETGQKLKKKSAGQEKENPGELYGGKGEKEPLAKEEKVKEKNVESIVSENIEHNELLEQTKNELKRRLLEKKNIFDQHKGDLEKKGSNVVDKAALEKVWEEMKKLEESHTEIEKLLQQVNTGEEVNDLREQISAFEGEMGRIQGMVINLEVKKVEPKVEAKPVAKPVAKPIPKSEKRAEVKPTVNAQEAEKINFSENIKFYKALKLAETKQVFINELKKQKTLVDNGTHDLLFIAQKLESGADINEFEMLPNKIKWLYEDVVKKEKGFVVVKDDTSNSEDDTKKRGQFKQEFLRTKHAAETLEYKDTEKLLPVKVEKESAEEMFKNEVANFKNKLQSFINGEVSVKFPADFLAFTKNCLVLVEAAEERNDRQEFEEAKEFFSDGLGKFLENWKKKTDAGIANPETVVVATPVPEKKGFFGNAWEKTKNIFVKSKELAKQKEVQDAAGDMTYKSLGTVFGFKFVTDLGLAVIGKGDIAEYTKQNWEDWKIRKNFEALVQSRQRGMDKNMPESIRKESASEFYEEAARVFRAINKSERIDPKEKQEMKEKLKAIARDYEAEKDGVKKEAHMATVQAIEAYTKNKVNGVTIAKDFLNLALTVTHTYALRGLVFAGASAGERYVRLKKEGVRREVKEGNGKDASKEAIVTMVNETLNRKSMLEEMAVGSFVETFNELTFHKWDKNVKDIDTKKKVVDFIKAFGILARVVGIGGLAVGEAYNEGANIFQTSFENIKDTMDHNVFEQGGALNNVADNMDRLTFHNTDFARDMRMDRASGVVGGIVGAYEGGAIEVPQHGVPNIVEATEISESNIDTTIHKGDGYYDVFKRQIEADPEKFGYKSGDNLDKFSDQKAREFLRTNDLWKNGKGISLQFSPDARIILHPDGNYDQTNVEGYYQEFKAPKAGVPVDKYISEEKAPIKNIIDEHAGSKREMVEQKIARLEKEFGESTQKEMDKNYLLAVKKILHDFGPEKGAILKGQMDSIYTKLNALEDVVARNPEAGADNMAGRVEDLKETFLKIQTDNSPANYENSLHMLKDIENTINSDIKIIENQTGDLGANIQEEIVRPTKTLPEGLKKEIDSIDDLRKGVKEIMDREFGTDEKTPFESREEKVVTREEVANRLANLEKDLGMGDHKEAFLKSVGANEPDVQEQYNKIHAQADEAEMKGRAVLEKQREAQLTAEQTKADKLLEDESTRFKTHEEIWQKEQEQLFRERDQMDDGIKQQFKALKDRFEDDPRMLRKLDAQLQRDEKLLNNLDLTKDTKASEVIDDLKETIEKNNLETFRYAFKNTEDWANEQLGNKRVDAIWDKMNEALKRGDSEGYLKHIQKLDDLKDATEKVKDIGLVKALADQTEAPEEKELTPEAKKMFEEMKKDASLKEQLAKMGQKGRQEINEEFENTQDEKRNRILKTADKMEERRQEISGVISEKQVGQAFKDAYKYLDQEQKETDFVRGVAAEKETFNLRQEIKALEKDLSALEKANEKGVPLQAGDIKDLVSQARKIENGIGGSEASEAFEDAEEYVKRSGKKFDLSKYMQIIENAIYEVKKGSRS